MNSQSPSRSNRPDPRQSSTRAEEATVASEEQGAEVAGGAERLTRADDYESSARLSGGFESQPEDILDEQDTFERHDSAAIHNEEGSED